MSFFDKVVKGLLDSMGEVALALNKPYRAPKWPKAFVLSTVAGSVMLSNFFLPAVLFAPLFFPVLKDKSLRKVVAYVTLFSLVTTLPLAFVEPYKVIDFAVRVFSSSAFFIYMISLVGWEGFVRALGEVGLPKEAILALRLLPYHLYSTLKDLNALVLARRARSFGGGLRETWWLLATSVASLLLRGTRRAETVSLAFKARGIALSKVPEDPSPTLVSLVVCGVSALVVLGGRLV